MKVRFAERGKDIAGALADFVGEVNALGEHADGENMPDEDANFIGGSAAMLNLIAQKNDGSLSKEQVRDYIIGLLQAVYQQGRESARKEIWQWNDKK